MKKLFKRLSKGFKTICDTLCPLNRKNPSEHVQNNRRVIFWLTWVLILSTILNLTFCWWKTKQLKIREEQVQILRIETQRIDELLKNKESDYKSLNETTKQEINQLKLEKEELNKKLQAKLEQRNKLRQYTATASVAPQVQVSGNCSSWADQAGITDKTNALYIFQRESGCRPNAVNRSSGATGVCQALPASKMASAGSDYLTNPVTQMRWCQSYALRRYGSWANARAFWDRNKWW